jgi:hypothetical protein
MSGDLFADVELGPIAITVLGGMYVAGAFFATAFVTGGLWLACGTFVPWARKWFFVSGAIAILSAAPIAGLVAVTGEAWVWPIAAGLLILGVLFIRLAWFRTPVSMEVPAHHA